MVQLLDKRFDSLLDFSEIDQPPHFGVDFPFTGQLDLEAVTVKSATFVPGSSLRQPMSSLKRESADQAHMAARSLHIQIAFYTGIRSGIALHM